MAGLDRKSVSIEREKALYYNMARVSISLAENDKREVSEVRIDGIVDTNTAGELEETIETLLSRERYRIILDLAGVEYISSAGWGAIISRIRDIRGNKGDILISGMVPNVREVFELLEFDNVLKNFKSLDDARAAFGISGSKDSSKKKDSEISRLEVLETTESSNGSSYSNANRVQSFDGPVSVEKLMKQSIEKDPFMSIGEIAQHINNLSDTSRVGWWKVFRLLKTNGLLSKKARFRLAKNQLNNSS